MDGAPTAFHPQTNSGSRDAALGLRWVGSDGRSWTMARPRRTAAEPGPPSGSNPTGRFPAIVAIGSVAVFAVNVAVRLVAGGSASPTLLAWLCAVSFGLAAAACLWQGSRDRAGWPWRLQGIGLGAYLAADVISQLVHRDLPTPSVADALWLSFYLAAYASIVLAARRRIRGGSTAIWVDGAIVGAVVGAWGLGLGLDALLVRGEGSAAAVASGLAYPVADLTLLVLLGVTLRVSPPRSTAAALQAGGLAAFLFADLAFLHGQLDGTWQSGGPADLLWVGGVTGIGLGALAWRRTPQVEAAEPTLVVPLLSALGVVILLLVGQGRSLRTASVALSVLAIVLIVVRVAQAWKEVRRTARIDRQLAVDPLTGLATRHALMERLEADLQAAPGNGVTLLVVDFERFEDVTGSLGWEVGERVLTTLAERLRHASPSGGGLARIGGDEFAVVVRAGSIEAAQDAAAQLRDVLVRPLNIGGIPLELAPRVGVARSPEHGANAAELIGSADLAVRQAARRHVPVAVFEATAADPSPRRLALVSDVRAGLATGQFRAHFQPQVDLATGRPIGAEALARWLHPTEGMIPPGEFIPLVVESGLLSALTLRMLDLTEGALHAAARHGSSLDISCNISAIDLADDAVIDRVEGVVRSTAGLASGLVIELTEDAVMVDRDRAVEVLERLQLIGARISVDDYGTGQASLSYLRDLPLDELKIDRGFVAGAWDDPRSATLARSTVELAHDLGLRTVAEGVEDHATHRWLQEIGCDRAQGFLYARPMPFDLLLDWVRTCQGTVAAGEAADDLPIAPSGAWAAHPEPVDVVSG